MVVLKQIYIRVFSSRLFSTSSAKLQPPVGFVGVGNMGRYMVNNLLKNGHSVVAYDMNKDALSWVEDKGAIAASTLQDVAAKCDCIITMLPASFHVREVYTHPSTGLLQYVKKGTLLIDSSTIEPSVAKSLAVVAETKGAYYIDAPVSGGVGGAEAGTLTFMVGGKASEVEAAKALLLAMGKNIYHCGEVGSGLSVKICNNMALAINMVATAEAMNLGRKLGLDLHLFAKIMNASSGRSWSSEVYNPVPGIMKDVPSSRGYDKGFSTALMTKDLGLALSASSQTGAPAPLGSLTHQIYQLLMNSGYKDKDFSVVYEFLKEQQSK